MLVDVFFLWMCWSSFINITGTAAAEVPESLYPTAVGGCFDGYVPEGTSSVTCRCQGNDSSSSSSSSSSALSFYWSGQLPQSATLELRDVGRGMNGSQYTCVMRSADGTVNRNATYDLRVAYGPAQDSARLLTPYGSGSFITNGTRELTLTCDVSDTYPAPWINWLFVGCPGGVMDTCTFIPGVRNDGGRVGCTATSTGHQQLLTSTSKTTLRLSYTPELPPRIRTQSSNKVLRSGDAITCTVSGGKPPVRHVFFNCSNPTLSDAYDVTNSLRLDGDVISSYDAISSSVIVNTSLATADPMVCSCQGEWEPEVSLYGRSSTAIFLLEYTATINNFTVNGTSDLVVTEEDASSVTFHCDAMGRASAEVTLHKQSDGRRFGNTVEVVGEDSGRRKIHRYEVAQARCEDMGVYTCKADSGYLRPSTMSVRLTVNCGPRPYTDKDRRTIVLRGRETELSLVAYPVPSHFLFQPLKSLDNQQSKETTEVTKEDTGAMFESQCKAYNTSWHLVTCRIRRGAIGGDQHTGTYNVTVTNAFGAFQFVLEVFPENDEPLISGTTAVLLSSMAAAIVFIVIVIFVVFLMRKRRGRDVECTRVAHRHSMAGYIADDDDDPSNSPLPFVEVGPISSDIEFRSTDPSNAPVSFSSILPSLSSDGGLCSEGATLSTSGSAADQGMGEALAVSPPGTQMSRAADCTASSPVPRAAVSPFFSSSGHRGEDLDEGKKDSDEKGDDFSDEKGDDLSDEKDDYPTIPSRTRPSTSNSNNTITVSPGDDHRSGGTAVVWMNEGEAGPPAYAPPDMMPSVEVPLGEYADLDDTAADDCETPRSQDSLSPLQSLVSGSGSRTRTFITKIYLPKQASESDRGHQDSGDTSNAAYEGPLGNEYAVVDKHAKGSKPPIRPTLDGVFPKEDQESPEHSTPHPVLAYEDAATYEEPDPFRSKAYEEVVLRGEIEKPQTPKKTAEPERPPREEPPKRKSVKEVDSETGASKRSGRTQSVKEVKAPAKTDTTDKEEDLIGSSDDSTQQRAAAAAGTDRDRHRLVAATGSNHALRKRDTKTEPNAPEPPRPKPVKTQEDVNRKERHAPEAADTRGAAGLTAHRKKKTGAAGVLSSSPVRQQPAADRSPAEREPVPDAPPKPRKRTRSKLTKRRRRSDVDSEADEAHILERL